jgi:hypothetical protein
MNNVLSTPLEQLLAQGWRRICPVQKTAFALIVAVSVLAFGFEMTNLTLHHDDVAFIFVEDTRIGSYLGRFGFGLLHYYSQSAYFMPFLQMAQAIVLMGLYGLVVARLWGLKRTGDVALVGALLCVFPYMAQIYQYNFCTVPFAAAHLLAALAVLLSVRATLLSLVAAAMLYVAAFSIYQAVLANAATLAVFWLLARWIFGDDGQKQGRMALIRPVSSALGAVLVGGILYVLLVALVGTSISTYQGADQAFSLRRSVDPNAIVALLDKGSRSFYLWPEAYLPGYVKRLQLVLLAAAALTCLWVPKTIGSRIGALVLLAIATLSPRTLHVLHPGGSFHALTLTAYAVVVAGALMVILRAVPEPGRKAAALVATMIVAAYVLQCNWISTVNLQNTTAHFAQTTQILARVRSLPDTQWDGNTIVVAGSMRLFNDYPFRKATGVSSDFINPSHLQHAARLLRDQAKVVPLAEASAPVQQAAAAMPPWPRPGSVAVVDGVALVVLGQAP